MIENPYRLGIDQIQKFLPHRAPFLLIDRVLEIHPKGDLGDLSSDSKVGVKVVAIKNATFNEAHFQGHFPGFAIMPGVLILESMAQAASMSLYPYLKDKIGGEQEFSCILVGIDGVRFRKPVVPGDQLRIETTVTKGRAKIWGFHCEATVDGQKVAEADLLANLVLGKAGA